MIQNNRQDAHGDWLIAFGWWLWATWKYVRNPKYRQGCKNLDVNCFSGLNSEQIWTLAICHGDKRRCRLNDIVNFCRQLTEMEQKERAAELERKAADEIAEFMTDANHTVNTARQ